MRVLVTGAGGYLGRQLLQTILRTDDIHVNAIVRPGGKIQGLRDRRIDLYQYDLSKKHNLGEILDGVDCIFHLAAGTSGSHFEMMLNTVVGTANLFNEIEKYNVKRFVLVSSFSVYQMTSLKAGEILDESCPIEPNLRNRDSYTITKVRQERLVQKKCAVIGLPLVIVRPGKIYGPKDHPLPPQLGLNIPGICFLYIGGNNLIPLTHVSNCAEAILQAGLVAGIEGKAINIVDDDLPTQRKFMHLYENVLGKLPRKIWIPYPAFKALALAFEYGSKKTKGNIPPVISRYRADNLWKNLHYPNKTAKRELNWTPRIGINEGVMDMFHSLMDLSTRR